MNVKGLKCSVLPIVQLFAAVGIMLVLMMVSGCVILGFLASAGPFEKGVIPSYDLQKHQDRKVMVWVECPHSAGADFDSSEMIAVAFQLYLTESAKFDPDNVIFGSSEENNLRLVNPVQIARESGAGYLLLIHVDTFEIDSLQIRNYYAGEMVTRAILMDTELGTAVWPRQPEGKMIHISVDMETEGRDRLVRRLAAGAAHCTVRYLYHCDKLKYRYSDERVSIQEAYEIETY